MKVLETSITIFCLSVALSTITYTNLYASDLISPDVKMIDQYTIKGPKNFHSGYDVGDREGYINVVVEIPKGTTAKWEVSRDDGTIRWEFKKGKPREVKYQGGYPVNYGSVPKTALTKKYGGDGDPLDVIVIGETIPRGTIVKVKLVGVLNIMEGDEFDAKLIGVRRGSPESKVSSIKELNSKFNGTIDKISSWFISYKGPDSGMRLEKIGTMDEAMEILMVSMEEYKKTGK